MMGRSGSEEKGERGRRERETVVGDEEGKGEKR
jgi:hypothetical protein